MIVYGIHSVLEALRSDPGRITRIYLRSGHLNHRLAALAEEARNRSIPVHFDPVEALERMTGSRQHQGVACEMTSAGYTDLETILAGAPSLLVLADGVEDPRNLGALIRTADATGVEGILLPDRHSCGMTPAVVKASAGAALHVPVGRIGNVIQALERLKADGFWVVGLDMAGDLSPEQLDASLRLLVVVGGEDRGVRRLVRENCDFLVALPLLGRVDSLNLSVAAGVLLYQILFNRQREGGRTGTAPRS